MTNLTPPVWLDSFNLYKAAVRAGNVDEYYPWYEYSAPVKSDSSVDSQNLPLIRTVVDVSQAPWTDSVGSVYTKHKIDWDYKNLVYNFNKQYGTDYRVAPPTWIDIYIDFLVNSYMPQYGDVLNRRWDHDADSIAQKQKLDNQYIQAIENYNAMFGMSVKPDPAALGPNAQLNVYHAHETGSFLSGLGLVIVVALAICYGPEVYTFFAGEGVAAEAVVADGSMIGFDAVSAPVYDVATQTGLSTMDYFPTFSGDSFGTSLATDLSVGADTTGFYTPSLYTDLNMAVDSAGAVVTDLPDGSSWIQNIDGSNFQVRVDGSTLAWDASGNVSYLDAAGNLAAVPTSVVTPLTVIAGIQQTLAPITSLLSGALAISSAWKALGKPQSVYASTSRSPTGVVTTVNRDGTITTTQPNGKTTTGKLPPGQPYTFPDGSTVVNNGDNTYTVVSVDGSSKIMQYSASIGGSNNLVMLAIAAIAAFAMLK